MASHCSLSKWFLAVVTALLMPFPAMAEPRQVHDLSAGWRFYQGKLEAQPLTSEYDDSGWQQVAMPHSWNRLGEYRTLRSEATNSFQGVGWYRLRIGAPNFRPGDRLILQFDGVGTVADVWLNGHHVGQHSGGYSAFRFDVTDFIKPAGQNTLVVKADNSKPAPGSPTADTLLMPKSPFSDVHSLDRDKKFIAALLWLADSDGQWDHLPSKYGEELATYRRFNRWSRSGRLTQIFSKLSEISDFPFEFDGKMILSRRNDGCGLKMPRKNYRRLRMH